MKYKNIVFDFGNVIAKFNEHAILSAFCSEENMESFAKAIFYDWQAIDAGTIPYEDYAAHAVSLLPKQFRADAERFFCEWHLHLSPLFETWQLIRTLKEQGYKLYILSNAPTHFAEHADYYEIIKEFDGIIFSAPIHMWKPNADIYQHLFKTFQLNPAECFFIDDRADNIAAAKACGMDGIVFTGNVDAVTDMLS